MPENEIPQPQVVTHRPFRWKKIILTVLVISIVTSIIAVGLYWYLGQNDGKINLPINTKQASRSASKSSTVSSTVLKQVPTNWKTYRAKNGVSFRYPDDWTLKQVSADQMNPDYTLVTSPKSFFLKFVTDVNGLGGGCGNADDMLTSVNVYQIKSAGFNNELKEPVSIVEWTLSNGKFLKDVGAVNGRKEILLTDPIRGNFPRLGDNGKVCLTYINTAYGNLSFSLGSSTFKGQYPDTSDYQKLSAKDYFNLEEVKTAELIMSSLNKE